MTVATHEVDREIWLTPAEAEKATDFAIRLWDDLRERKAKSRDGWRDVHPRDTLITAMKAEKAFAKWRRVPWDPQIGREYAGCHPDVDGFGVRHSGYPYPHLILRPGDNPELPFVLISGSDRTYKVMGWEFGYIAMHREYFSRTVPGAMALARPSRAPAWFYPCKLLLPITWDMETPVANLR